MGSAQTSMRVTLADVGAAASGRFLTRCRRARRAPADYRDSSFAGATRGHAETACFVAEGSRARVFQLHARGSRRAWDARLTGERAATRPETPLNRAASGTDRALGTRLAYPDGARVRLGDPLGFAVLARDQVARLSERLIDGDGKDRLIRLPCSRLTIRVPDGGETICHATTGRVLVDGATRREPSLRRQP
jgi:hypothetical protein